MGQDISLASIPDRFIYLKSSSYNLLVELGWKPHYQPDHKLKDGTVIKALRIPRKYRIEPSFKTGELFLFETVNKNGISEEVLKYGYFGEWFDTLPKIEFIIYDEASAKTRLELERSWDLEIDIILSFE